MSRSLLYSQRKAIAEGNAPTLQTQVLPEAFRTQICYIFAKVIGRMTTRTSRLGTAIFSASRTASDFAWEDIYNGFSYEKGHIPLGNPNDAFDVQSFDFIYSKPTEDVIDFVEFGFQYIDRHVRDWDYPTQHRARVAMTVDEAFSEFNRLASQNGVGYSYTNGEIISVSSSFIHSQVVEPALLLLRSQGFAAAEQEFMRAHAAMRRGDYQAVLVEAVKAFESTMKVIIQRRGWTCDPNATAKVLVSCLEKNRYFPNSLQTQFSHFLDLLVSGVPALGNKNGRHGAGDVPHAPPRDLAEYALNLTASNIVFLVARL